MNEEQVSLEMFKSAETDINLAGAQVSPDNFKA
jgi:hypothetical protein